jgi:acetyl esterase/lipase
MLKTTFYFYLFICFSLLFSSTAQQTKKKKSLKIPDHMQAMRDIEYSANNGQPQLLDLYFPKEYNGKVPVIIWVHGGGWKNGSKEKAKGLWLVEHGFAIASINYRLIPDHQWPAQINDCRAAVRFLRSNAAKYGLDGKNIAAWGSSAGGHLVAVLGSQDLPKDEKISSRVQAVLDWFGPVDLLTMPPNVVSPKRTLEQVSKSNGALLLGSTVRDVPKLAKEASPFWNVSADDSPFLIMHGDEDPGVPIEQSHRLHAKQKKMGAPSQLHVVKGAKHGGKEFLTQEVNDIILKFFTKTLKKTK